MGGQGATRGQGERKGGTSVKPPASKDDGREIGTTTLHCTLAVRRREFLFLALFSSSRRWYLWPPLTHTLADLDTEPRPRERLLDAVVGDPVGQARELQRARFRRVKASPRVQIRALGEVGAAYDGCILVVKRGNSLTSPGENVIALHFESSYLNGIRVFLLRNWFQCHLVRSGDPKKINSGEKI